MRGSRGLSCMVRMGIFLVSFESWIVMELGLGCECVMEWLLTEGDRSIS